MRKKLSLIIMLLSSIYFVSQFCRASLGVVAIYITSDLSLNSEQIGRLGGIFFLSFALTQVPLGIILDAFNPIKIITFMLFLIFIGTYLFSISENYTLLILARGLQGVGCGVCLMGPLVILTKILTTRDFAYYSGLVMGLGGLGALFATEPFYYIVSQIGWSKAFYFFSFFILFLIILLFLFPKEKKLQTKNKSNFNFKAFKMILLNRNFLLMLPMSMFGYASAAFILTLWGGKFLSIVHNYKLENISFILMFMALFWTLGSFSYGYIEKKIDNKKLIITSSSMLMAFLISLLCISDINNLIFILILFCFLGFFGAFTLILMAHYRVLFEEEIIGKVLTTANLFNFFGVFITQWFTGVVIFNLNDKYGFSITTSFNIAFMIIVLCLLISTIFYLKTDEV
ncbi:MAG: hypothetical protein CMJ06_06070 [Pelagibacterales bacterium]|nr:hypothetical protein [Pelagibacterales bacterium]OUU61201.1 MAG: hypothetical protein CBC22_08215 [Alphaproteobacteria bacterium TMED62]